MWPYRLLSASLRQRLATSQRKRSIMAGLTATPKREETIDFTVSYGLTPQTFATLKDSPFAKLPHTGETLYLAKDEEASQKAIDEIAAEIKGRTVGVQTASLGLSLLDKYFKDSTEIREYKTTDLNHRRALIPASGFYEWRRDGKNKSQPYWVRPRNGGIVAFGALVETWSGADGSQIDTTGILTTSANGLLRPIHQRMPVVVKPEDFARWLDCKTLLPKDVADIMRPVQDDFFEAIPVSEKVNKVANTSPDLQTRVEESLTAEQSLPKRKKKPGPEEDSGDQLSMF